MPSYATSRILNITSINGIWWLKDLIHVYRAKRSIPSISGLKNCTCDNSIFTTKKLVLRGTLLHWQPVLIILINPHDKRDKQDEDDEEPHHHFTFHSLIADFSRHVIDFYDANNG